MGESGAAGGRAFGIAALAWAEKAGAGRSTLSAAMEKRTHDSERRTPASRSRARPRLSSVGLDARRVKSRPPQPGGQLSASPTPRTPGSPSSGPGRHVHLSEGAVSALRHVTHRGSTPCVEQHEAQRSAQQAAEVTAIQAQSRAVCESVLCVCCCHVVRWSDPQAQVAEHSKAASCKRLAVCRFSYFLTPSPRPQGTPSPLQIPRTKEPDHRSPLLARGKPSHGLGSLRGPLSCRPLREPTPTSSGPLLPEAHRTGR